MTTRNKSFVDFHMAHIRTRMRTLEKSSSIRPIPPPRQYEHFLAYLRRQTLAFKRRKSREQQGNIDHIQTVVKWNLTKQPTFQSISYYSFTSSINEQTTIRPLNLQRSKSIISEKQSTEIVTPRNSVVDELNPTLSCSFSEANRMKYRRKLFNQTKSKLFH